MIPAAMEPAIYETADLAVQARRAFGRRVVATLIDLLLLSLLSFFVNAVFGVTHVTSGSPVPPPGGGSTNYTSSTDVGWGWLTVVWLIYYAGLEALFGATVGKVICRLRVTDRAGRRPPLRHILVRNVARLMDAPVLYLIGGGVALLSAWRQRIGDHLAGTVVLPCEAITAPLLTPAALRRRMVLAGVILLAFLTFSGAYAYYGRPALVVRGMVNTHEMMFNEDVSSYALSAPVWGLDTVTYQVTYVKANPVDICHARLTLAWTFPAGWQPRYGQVTSCGAHTP